MHIRLISIGTKMPNWVEQGYQEYAKRLPREFQLQLIEIPAHKRMKTSNIGNILEQEGNLLLKACQPGDHIVALERTGKHIDTRNLAEILDTHQQVGQNISILVGGPEGISSACLQQANEQWSLSKLTLPHPLVRVVIAEQIYRAWSILCNHPYHR